MNYNNIVFNIIKLLALKRMKCNYTTRDSVYIHILHVFITIALLWLIFYFKIVFDSLATKMQG